MDLCFANASGSSKKKGAADVTDAELDLMIEKAISDTLCKSLTMKEIDTLVDDEGLTARARLRERKVQNLRDPKKWPLGKNFYNFLIAKYKSADSPQSKIKAQNEDEDVDESLLKAMIAYSIVILNININNINTNTNTKY